MNSTNLMLTRRRTQEMADTYQRALTGGPFYAAAWLLVGIYGHAFSRAPIASGSLLLAFIGLSIWRFRHRPLREGANGTAIKRWLVLHWSIVLLTTALWGASFFWATIDPAFGLARVTSLLFTLGLTTAIAHTFSMRRSFAFAAIGLLSVPGLVLLWSDPADRANGLMMTIYLAYVVVSLLRANTEYQKRLDLDQELRNQRDLFSQLSRIDPLTELANRRQFAEVLAAAAVSARRNNSPLTLLLLDVDHFKQINDSHGHAVGDACLLAIGSRLKTSFSGQGDLAARVGGEEFAVILEGQDLASAAQRAELFCVSLAGHPIALDELIVSITASIGVAQLDPSAHADVDDLYQAADSAVYRAKRAGRNRVCRVEPGQRLAPALA